jgi:dTDP-4-dehydrorhamnose reductase
VRIAVTGAAGLLGTELLAGARARGHEVVALTRAELDVTDPMQARSVIAAACPDAVIQCAAYSAVDRAEQEPELARAVNRDGAAHVGAAATAVGARFVYVSTDYVFDGRKGAPYLPGDAPGPLSTYGRTKLEGERTAREASPDALVVRTSWLYAKHRGFVSTMLERARRGERLRVVDDQRGRPTWVRDAALGILELTELGERDVWHVAGGGDCTRFELVREALHIAGLEAEVEPVSSAAFDAPAARPAYSVLDLSATEARLGRPMRDWREGLRLCLAETSCARRAPSISRASARHCSRLPRRSGRSRPARSRSRGRRGAAIR